VLHQRFFSGLLERRRPIEERSRDAGTNTMAQLAPTIRDRRPAVWKSGQDYTRTDFHWGRRNTFLKRFVDTRCAFSLLALYENHVDA
jgi:hypothetical protein